MLHHRWNSVKRDFVVQVRWQGLEEKESSWEHLTQLVKDIPLLVKQYVDGSHDEKLKTYWGKLDPRQRASHSA